MSDKNFSPLVHSPGKLELRRNKLIKKTKKNKKQNKSKRKIEKKKFLVNESANTKSKKKERKRGAQSTGNLFFLVAGWLPEGSEYGKARG